MNFCEKTLCGYSSENVIENYVSENWKDVDCKKCLEMKESYKAGVEADEKIIVEQMGDMI